MAFLIQLVLVAIFILIILQIFKMVRGDGAKEIDDRSGAGGPVIEGEARDVSSPGKSAAETLKDFENARAELKGRYPAVFAMLGGYLNSHTIGDLGSLEAAVKDMVKDWAPRRDEVARELTRLLADNETEEEVRAIILAACDAEFEQEGYRAWLTWLLGQFNDLS